jgi:hypothetical protein
MKTLGLIFTLPATYTFAGNNRDASVTTNADASATLKVVNLPNGGEELSEVHCSTPVKITKARLLSTGAAKLQIPPGKIAGEIKLGFKDGAVSLGEITLAMVEWNKWEEKEIAIDISSHSKFSLSVLAGTVFRLDDFNIQDAYNDQHMVPMLELEMLVGNSGTIKLGE